MVPFVFRISSTVTYIGPGKPYFVAMSKDFLIKNGIKFSGKRVAVVDSA